MFPDAAVASRWSAPQAGHSIDLGGSRSHSSVSRSVVEVVADGVPVRRTAWVSVAWANTRHSRYTKEAPGEAWLIQGLNARAMLTKHTSTANPLLGDLMRH